MHPGAYAKNLIPRWNVEEALASTVYFLLCDHPAYTGGRTGDREFGIRNRLAAGSLRATFCSQAFDSLDVVRECLALAGGSEQCHFWKRGRCNQRDPFRSTSRTRGAISAFPRAWAGKLIDRAARRRRIARGGSAFRRNTTAGARSGVQMTGIVKYEGKTERLE
jgi:hypothetical protein